MMAFSIDDILNSPCGHLNQHLKVDTTKRGELLQDPGKKKVQKGTKIKEWIEKNLWHWSRANNRVMLTEQVFHKERKWRFDWMLCGVKVAIEYEGIFSEKSRHTTIKGYSGDIDKYNEAAKAGITVFRYTAKNYKNLITDLNKFV